MALYRVDWSIDIEAEDPREAAALAREYQRAPGSTANVFTVHKHVGGHGGQYQRWHVDLQNSKEDHREFPAKGTRTKHMAL